MIEKLYSSYDKSIKEKDSRGGDRSQPSTVVKISLKNGGQSLLSNTLGFEGYENFSGCSTYSRYGFSEPANKNISKIANGSGALCAKPLVIGNLSRIEWPVLSALLFSQRVLVEIVIRNISWSDNNVKVEVEETITAKLIDIRCPNGDRISYIDSAWDVHDVEVKSNIISIDGTSGGTKSSKYDFSTAAGVSSSS